MRRTSEGNPPAVLIVDDDSTVRRLLAAALRHLDYHVLQAGSLEEGRERLGDEPDVVLLDALLPDGNGTDLLAAIRRQPQVVLVAMVTALKPEELSLPPDVWPDAHFRKPIQMRQILEWLERMLHSPER